MRILLILAVIASGSCSKGKKSKNKDGIQHVGGSKEEGSVENYREGYGYRTSGPHYEAGQLSPELQENLAGYPVPSKNMDPVFVLMGGNASCGKSASFTPLSPHRQHMKPYFEDSLSLFAPLLNEEPDFILSCFVNRANYKGPANVLYISTKWDGTNSYPILEHELAPFVSLYAQGRPVVIISHSYGAWLGMNVVIDFYEKNGPEILHLTTIDPVSPKLCIRGFEDGCRNQGALDLIDYFDVIAEKSHFWMHVYQTGNVILSSADIPQADLRHHETGTTHFRLEKDLEHVWLPMRETTVEQLEMLNGRL